MSIKVGDKFIIEIGTIAELPDGKKKYFIKPFESLVFDKTGLAQLETVEEALEKELEEARAFAYQNGYDNALYDVNHAMTVLENMTDTEREKWFEDYASVGEVVRVFTIQRIIESTKAYEEKKKAEEESIKVGDEVLYGSSKLLVTKITNASICTVNADGKVDTWRVTAELIKTGRHFDEAEQLLDKLRGEE